VKEVCITQVHAAIGVEIMQGLDPGQWPLGIVYEGVWKPPDLRYGYR